MRLTAKQKFAVLAAVAAALAVDNLRLRVTCRALEKVVNYAVGGIHLDGAGEFTTRRTTCRERRTTSSMVPGRTVPVRRVAEIRITESIDS